MIRNFTKFSEIGTLSKSPFDQFRVWMDEAKNCSLIRNPDAACLSTVGADGYPDGRFVLVREMDDRGFVFYTNRFSKKGRDLEILPKASMSVYWEPLGKQVRITGDVEMVSDQESDRYFYTRPRGSQLAAWASKQSQVLNSRDELEALLAKNEKEFSDVQVKRPTYWIGYRIKPIRIEFWIEQPYRLHDRFLYQKNPAGDWDIVRLSP